MSKKLLTIVIPAYNEAKNIKDTLNSLYHQTDLEQKPYPKENFQILIVNNASTDNTHEIINEFAHLHADLQIKIITEPQKGVVQARITGYNYALEREDTPYLASSDADTIFHKHWVNNLIATFNNNADMISCAGCFPDSFWSRVPNLVSKYATEIGTIFFNPTTISNYWDKEK